MSFPCWPHLFVQTFFATLATEAAFTVAAKTARSIEHIGAVDPHAASLYFRCNIQRKVDVLAPYTGSQPIARIIGERNRFGRSAERHRDQHRAKDLHLGNSCRGRDIGEKRWWKEIPFRWTRPRGLPHVCTFLDTLRYQALNLLELPWRDDRPHIYRFIQWVTKTELLHTDAQFADQAVRNVLLHE